MTDVEPLLYKIGIIGLTHFKQINSNAYLSTTIGLNYSKTDITNYGFDRLTEVSFQRDISKTAKTGYNFSTSYNSKINSRLFVKIGLDNQLLGLDLYSKNKQINVLIKNLTQTSRKNNKGPTI